MLLVFVACASEREEAAPFAVVDKLDGYQRRMFLDRPLGNPAPDNFVVTMITSGDATFVREWRAGVWWSSSPTPGTFVYGEPRIEPGCDDCHRDHAESIGMFTVHAAVEASHRGQIAYITCPAEGVTPCDVATYRMIEWRD